MKKPGPSRFSSHGTLIAVLALVAGIVVTVEAAAHQFGLSRIVAERAQASLVMLRPVQLITLKKSISIHGEQAHFSAGEI